MVFAEPPQPTRRSLRIQERGASATPQPEVRADEVRADCERAPSKEIVLPKARQPAKRHRVAPTTSSDPAPAQTGLTLLPTLPLRDLPCWVHGMPLCKHI